MIEVMQTPAINEHIWCYRHEVWVICIHDAESQDLKESEFIPDKNLINQKLKKLKSNLAQIRKIWIRDYLHLLTKRDKNRQKNSPHTKSLIIPKVNDWVLIKDGSSELTIRRRGNPQHNS